MWNRRLAPLPLTSSFCPTPPCLWLLTAPTTEASLLSRHLLYITAPSLLLWVQSGAEISWRRTFKTKDYQGQSERLRSGRLLKRLRGDDLWFFKDRFADQRATVHGSVVKNLPARQEMLETWAPSLGQEDPLEWEMATHSCILDWRTPWTEEPGGLQSTGSQRVDTTGQQSTHTRQR